MVATEVKVPRKVPQITYDVAPLYRLLGLAPEAEELFIFTASVSPAALAQVQRAYSKVRRTCIVGMFSDTSLTGSDFICQAAEQGWRVGLFPTLHAKLILVRTIRGWHAFIGSSNFSLNANNGSNVEFNIELFYGKQLPKEVRLFKEWGETLVLTEKQLNDRQKSFPRYLPVGL